MKNTILLTITCLFIFSACGNYHVSQNAEGTKHSKLSSKQTIDENGICWQDCLMPAIYENEVTSYNIYTGDASTENVELEEVIFTLKPASTKWVKKKADRNCLSADPNDCLVWCLVEVPAETESLTILSDTTQSDQFEVKEITKKILVKKGGYVEKRQAICNDKMSGALVMEVQKMLGIQNYNTGPQTEKINTIFRAGLNNYQRENGLPVGLLNFQTLDKLGVQYKDNK